jgi:hypothetical protein
MLRAMVTKASPRDCKQASGKCGLKRFITRSFLAKCVHACAQYSGVLNLIGGIIA